MKPTAYQYCKAQEQLRNGFLRDAAADATLWADLLCERIGQWKALRENAVKLTTFRKRYTGKLTAENYETIRAAVHADAISKTRLIELHDNYAANPEILGERLYRYGSRPSDREERNLYEYIAKVEILDELLSAVSLPPTTSVTLTLSCLNPAILKDRRLCDFKAWLDPLMQTSPLNALFVPYYACWACGLLTSEKIPDFFQQLCDWYPSDLPFAKGTPEFKRRCKALNTERENVSAGKQLIPYDSLHATLNKRLSVAKFNVLYPALQQATCSLAKTLGIPVVHR